MTIITEDKIALEFVQHHARRLRYVNRSPKQVAQRWLVLNDRTGEYEHDDVLHVVWLVRKFVRQIAMGVVDDPAQAQLLCSANFISAIERLARCDPRFAVTPEEMMQLPVKRKLKREKEP